MVHIACQVRHSLLGMIEIRRISVQDAIDSQELGVLLDGYSRESAMPEIGTPDAQLHMYAAMEQAGALHAIGAYQSGDLIGFLLMIVSVLPHYGKPVGSTESFYVADYARHTGAGLELLREAERWALEMGAAAFLVSAPTRSRLEVVMQRQGYRQSNVVFAKGLQ